MIISLSARRDFDTIVVSGSILKGTGGDEFRGSGIRCRTDDAFALSVGNVLIGFGRPMDGCSAGDNSINSN